MATLAGKIIDGDTGEQVPARVQVLASDGEFTHPDAAILKVGPGAPFFYSDGEFNVEVVRGRTRVVVERGTEYVPTTVSIEAPTTGAVAVEIVLERWSGLGGQGWHLSLIHISEPTRPY